MNFKGIIFDMDGTMVDNMMVHHRAWQIKLAELGLELDLEAVRQTIHGKNEEILERLFGERFTPAERQRLAWEKEARYREVFRDSLQLVAGLPAFLEKIQQAGIQMAIGTAAPPENVDFVLDTLQIRHLFKVVVHAGHVEFGKPNPQVFQLAAQGMHLDVRDCLVLEDSPTGVLTAKNAGCRAIVITTTHTQEEFLSFDNVLFFIKDYTDARLSGILTHSYSAP
jgi:beta-phosphoglucomutase